MVPEEGNDQRPDSQLLKAGKQRKSVDLLQPSIRLLGLDQFVKNWSCSSSVVPVNVSMLRFRSLNKAPNSCSCYQLLRILF